MSTFRYSSLTSRSSQQSSSLESQTTPTGTDRSSLSTDRGSLNTERSSIISLRTQSSSSSSLVNLTSNNTLQNTPRRSQLSTNQPTSPDQKQKSRPQQPTTPNQPPVPKRDSPGAWRHPRAQEIAQRQRSSTFGPDNVSIITKCIVAVLATETLRWTLPGFVWKLVSPLYLLLGDAPLWLLRTCVLYFLVKAVKPLYSGPDQLLDIDLNATQRSLLGLDPNATPPATPATKYITPPRYARSVTPQTRTPGSRGSSPAGSPLMHKDGAGYYRQGDSLAASTASRRASFGSDPRRQSFSLSGFGTPSKDGSVFAPQTPSPIGKASGVTFSNKWLYHKSGLAGSTNRDPF